VAFGKDANGIKSELRWGQRRASAETLDARERPENDTHAHL